MEMRNHICWDPRAVYQIVRIDAEAVGDTVFRAVHSPQPILMSTISTDKLTVGTDQKFLEAFTNPDIPEIFALLLGDSGIGKTHFIHWLRLHVPVDDKTRVVSISKVGTSLRNIVEKIIDQLPKEMRGQYLNKLTTMGGESHTPEQLQEKLLDSLAQAVSAEADRRIVQDPVQLEILRGLAPLFRDPHIRSQWFLANNRESIIKDLTRHVYEMNKEYSRREQDRRFEPDDFRVQGVQEKNVSREARLMLEYFRGAPHLRDVAADLTNQCLDAAIGEALRFTGEDLVALVAEVRKHLHEQGLSLILYIEDLSRMQGVDKALLDALTTPSDQGDQKLCTIRWIAAMTTGYFDRLEATITTRINLMGKVEADQELWDSPQAQGRLAAFAGRYLNAVRLGMNALEEWDYTANDVPNACDACEYRGGCHTAFGAGGEFGLYPFSVEGLWNMTKRSGPQHEFWFKPRRLLKSIVAPMLSEHGRDIVEGRFPNPAMIEELGGGKLDAVEKMELSRIAGADAPRHLALQELWQSSPKVTPFHEGILTAFNLQPLPGKKHAGTVVTSPPSREVAVDASGSNAIAATSMSTNPSPAPSPLVEVNPIIEKLRDWGNGKQMEDTVAQSVRGLVFTAVADHVDWDRAGISRTAYVGSSPRPFTRQSIVFKRQITKPGAVYRLELPLNDDEHSNSRAAVALQGLYLFEKNGHHWDFEDGSRYCITVQSCLEEWAAAALDLVRGVVPNNEEWNALDAATELLAIGAALSGNISVDSPREDIWSGIWELAPVTALDRMLSSDLQRVADTITNKWGELQKHVNARSFGTKGSRASNFLNPAERERVLIRLMKNNWKLCMTPNPEAKMHSDFTVIARLYQKIAQSLQPALEAEANAYRSWLAKMDESFGPDMTSRTDIINVFGELQQTLNDAAFCKREVEQFQQSLDTFETAFYNDARKRASLVVGTGAEKLAPYLFAKKNVANAMRKGASLAEAAERYLAAVSVFHDDRMEDIEGTAGDGLLACWNGINDTFNTLDAALEQLSYDEGVGGQEP